MSKMLGREWPCALGKIFMLKTRLFPSGLLGWVNRHYQRRDWLYLGVVCGVLDVALWVAWGLAPTMERSLAPSVIEAEIGQAYHTVPRLLAPGLPYWVRSDTVQHPRASRLVLLEDGHSVGP